MSFRCVSFRLACISTNAQPHAPTCAPLPACAFGGTSSCMPTCHIFLICIIDAPSCGQRARTLKIEQTIRALIQIEQTIQACSLNSEEGLSRSQTRARILPVTRSRMSGGSMPGAPLPLLLRRSDGIVGLLPMPHAYSPEQRLRTRFSFVIVERES